MSVNHEGEYVKSLEFVDRGHGRGEILNDRLGRRGDENVVDHDGQNGKHIVIVEKVDTGV